MQGQTAGAPSPVVDVRLSGELSISDIFSWTFEVYRKNLLPLYAVSLVIGVGQGIASSRLDLLFLSPLTQISSQTPGANASPDQFQAYLWALVVAVVVLIAVELFLLWIFGTLENGVVTSITARSVNGRTESVGANIKSVLGRMPSLWFAWLMGGLAIVAGFLALFVPGFILTFMFYLVTPVVIIERAGPIRSLGRSRALMSHRWGKSFGLSILLGLVAGIPVIAIGTVTPFFGFASRLVSDVAQALFTPIPPIGATLFYYSMKARFDYPTAANFGARPVGFCPSCGEPFLADQAFCRKCGYDLRTRTSAGVPVS